MSDQYAGITLEPTREAHEDYLISMGEADRIMDAYACAIETWYLNGQYFAPDYIDFVHYVEVLADMLPDMEAYLFLTVLDELWVEAGNSIPVEWA